MTINQALDETRDAVEELARAADRSAAVWTVPRAPGKWSPSQIVEHVARTMEQSAIDVSGARSHFPSLPRLIRPLVRRFFFERVLRSGVFPKSKATRAFNPETGSATPAEARERLATAFGTFEAAARARAAGNGLVQSRVFGTVPVTDYTRFEAVHIRHHRAQMPLSS